MNTPRTGRRGLARIVAASLAIGALVLPLTAGSAAAAPAGNTVVAPAQQTPPGDDGGSGGGGTGGGSTDPDTGSGGGSTEPDTGSGGGGSGGGNTGNNEPDPTPGGGNTGNTDPEPTGRPTVPTDPNANQRAEEQRRLEEQRKQEQQRLRDEAEAARKAEEQRIKAEQRAIREAQERREQEAKARQSWLDRGQPRRMVTVRIDRVEVVNRGNLTTLVPRRPGTLTIQALDRMVPNDWITIDGDTATVDTTIVLTPGVNFEISGIPTVRLTGGPELSDASALYTGTGRVTVEGVTLSGVDRGSGQPLPFEAAGRPFIAVNTGGEFNATDATITDMGLPEIGEENPTPAVKFGTDSRGSLVRTTFQRNNIGVQLSGSRDVVLDGVTVSESEADGIELSGDRGTRMANLRVEGNGGNGMVVSGESSDRPITGITTNGNKLYGLVVMQQQGPRISAVTTEADKAGGLRLNNVENANVTDFSATDEPIGIFTHVGSTGIVLDNIRASGGRRGVVVEKSTTKLELKNSTVEGSRVAGVNLGGKDIQVNGVQVSDAKAGVRIERGAGHIQLTGMTIEGGRDGVVSSPGAEDVTFTDLTINHVEDGAIRLATPHAVVNGGTINGGSTGIHVTAPATITAVAINGPSAGMRVRSPELVRAENVAIEATDLGLDVSAGSQFVLANSSVHALEAVRGVFGQEGVNNISLPPLNLLAAMGVPLILLAIVLEQIHSFRQRRVGGNKKRLPPAIPVGAG